MSLHDSQSVLLTEAVVEHETPIKELTKANLPGERLVDRRVTAIRSDFIIVDIGNPEPLYVPLKPALDESMVFQVGDSIVVTMNDHNAVVDYHHAKGESRHRILHGQLIEPLPVGQDKAIVRTAEGERSYPIASRARSKLAVMPIGGDLVLLLDETGQLVDAQLGSVEAVHQSGLNNKVGRLTGINRQVQAVYKTSTNGTDRITAVVLPEGKEQVLRFRPPLPILRELKENQRVVLLMDEENYIVDISTWDPPPGEFRRSPTDR